MTNSEFLAILACPVCDSRPPLEERGEYLVCTAAGHGFPVKDGIPHLLPESVIEPDALEELLRGR